MERLDYRINENGVERRTTFEGVMKVLAFLHPHICEEIEQKMRWDGQPFEYEWAGQKIKIEYKGPNPHEALNQPFGRRVSR